MTKLARRSMLTGAVGLGLTAITARAWAGPETPPGRRTPLQVDHGATTPRELVQEVVYQTSFETDEDGWTSDSTWYSTYNQRTGGRSLLYRRSNSTSYTLPGVEIPVMPGRIYDAVAWARTSGLSAGTYSGARFGLEGYEVVDNTPKWIRGAYSGDVRYGSDWVRMQTSYLVPDNCDVLKVIAYLFKGLTGSAWFDDITVTVREPRQLETELHRPSYRGLLLPGEPEQIDLICRLPETDSHTGHSVVVTVIDGDGVILDQSTTAAAASVAITRSTSTWPDGDFTVVIELIGPGSTVVEAEQWSIRKQAAPSTYVDAHGRLIRNGEPYFPVAVYDNKVQASLVEPLAELGVNTLLCYLPVGETELDLVEDAGLNLLYSLKDHFYDVTGYRPLSIQLESDEEIVITDTVTSLKDHPALLGWYVNDELQPLPYGDRLINHYELISSLDPDHPTLNVHFDPEPASLYLRCSDVFGPDRYPVTVGGNDLSTCTDLVQTVRAALPNRAQWAVTQAFSVAVTGKPGRFPTLTEMRNMAWQYLCEGATGIIFYGLHQLRKEDPAVLPYAEGLARIGAVTSEIADLTEALLSVLPPPIAALTGNPDWANLLVRRTATTGFAFVVNHSADTVTGQLSVPGAVSVEVIGEDREVTADASGVVSDEFEPWAVHLYRWELPTTTSLAQQTRGRLLAADQPGAVGLATALTQTLDRAGHLIERGEDPAPLLEQYRDRITRMVGRQLTTPDVTVLTRLSTAIIS